MPADSDGLLKTAEPAFPAPVVGKNADGGLSCVSLTPCAIASQMLVTERLIEAEILARQCLENLQQSYPSDDPVFLGPLHILAAVLFEHGETTRAREVFRRMQRVRIERPEDRVAVHHMAATLLDGEGKTAAAEAEYREALRESQAAGPGDSADTGAILNALGLLYIKEKRYAEAGAALDRALMICNKAKDAAPTDLMKVLVHRGVLHERRREWLDAERDLHDALLIADRNGPMDAGSLRIMLLTYARVLHRNHHGRAARIVEARAAVLERNPAEGCIVDVADLLGKHRLGPE